MKMSTRTITSLLVITAVAATIPGASRRISGGRINSQFDRLLQRHDRKLDMRAQIIGMDADELRFLLKKQSFESIMKQCGFSSTRDFRLALLGYLRGELQARGWSKERIDRFVMTRSPRLLVMP